MELIFEIMDKDEFLKMFYSGVKSNEFNSAPLQEDAENANLTLNPQDGVKRYANREIFDINIIYESFLLCIEKILQ